MLKPAKAVPVMLLLASLATFVPLSTVIVVSAKTDEEKIQKQRPVQVFILAGQSNMLGMGSIEHLDLLVQNDTTLSNEYRANLWDETTKSYKSRDDVFIKFDDNYGNLTVGGFAGRNCFGPELMFGWTVGDAMQQQQQQQQDQGHDDGSEQLQPQKILLIKTAWGGKTLAIDFRPPASGEGKYKDVKPIKYGYLYRQMIVDVLDTLQNIEDYVPDYDDSVGYELAGFVWFQGWNDMLVGSFVAEYGSNLANLIRDIRADLDEPELPVIVGELGMHGLHPTGPVNPVIRVLLMRSQEKAVPLMKEFRDNSLYVRTAPYVVANGTSYNGDYHYYGRADTYFHIGQAFGRGMLQLWDAAKRKRSTTAKSES